MNRNLLAAATLSLAACNKDGKDEEIFDATEYIPCETQESGFIDSARDALNGQESRLLDSVYEVTEHVSLREDEVLSVATSTSHRCAAALDLHVREVNTGVEADLNIGNNAVDVLASNYHDWLEDYNAGRWTEDSDTEIRAQYIEVGENNFNRQMDHYFTAVNALAEEWMHASAHHALGIAGHTELDPTMCGRVDLADPEDCPASDEVHAWTLAAQDTLHKVENEKRKEIAEAIMLIY